MFRIMRVNFGMRASDVCFFVCLGGMGGACIKRGIAHTHCICIHTYICMDSLMMDEMSVGLGERDVVLLFVLVMGVEGASPPIYLGWE